MLRRFCRLTLSVALLWCGSAPARANEGGEKPAGHGEKAEKTASENKEPAAEPKLPGVRQVPLHKPTLAPIKTPAVEGMKGVESYCGAIAASAQGERLAWQEQRVRQLQAQLAEKIAEVAAKTAELRDWVDKREQLLARASAAMVSIYSKMSPEAAAAQLREMDDDTAAALLLKLKPATASAMMNEMDAARAARLSDLLTGAQAKTEAPAKTDGKKS